MERLVLSLRQTISTNKVFIRKIDDNLFIARESPIRIMTKNIF